MRLGNFRSRSWIGENKVLMRGFPAGGRRVVRM
jgi:hypothetical protein